MGTWGAGIYENDSTRDYIDGIIDNISNAVRDIVKRDYTLLHAGMPQSDLFMCYIDLLNATTCTHHYRMQRWFGNGKPNTWRFGSLPSASAIRQRITGEKGLSY